MSKRRRSSQPVDMYEFVTNRIMDKLREGVVPWRQPWRSASGGLNRNMVTGKPYRGGNQLLLSLMPYASPWWGTIKHINAKGGRVSNGERHTKLVIWNVREKVDEETEEVRRIPMLRQFHVWNAEQCTGLQLPDDDPAPPGFTPEAAAEAIMTNMPNPPRIVYGSHKATYTRGMDRVALPPRDAFVDSGAFYSTALHELGHSTGHEQRLDRPEIVDGPCFGSKSYGKEELVAEFTSAMLCAEARIDGTLPESTSYIDGWLKIIGGDTRLALLAAGRAQRAADFILGRQFKDEEQSDD